MGKFWLLIEKICLDDGEGLSTDYFEDGSASVVDSDADSVADSITDSITDSANTTRPGNFNSTGIYILI